MSVCIHMTLGKGFLDFPSGWWHTTASMSARRTSAVLMSTPHMSLCASFSFAMSSPQEKRQS